MVAERNCHVAVEDVSRRLFEYCRSEEWAGYDPYDGLNSRLFKASPLRHFKWTRLAWTQAFKRSPVNLRPLLRVPKAQNPKGIALFLQAAIVLRGMGVLQDDDQMRCLVHALEKHATLSECHWGWGYNFDWQTRGRLVPCGEVNIICTTFAANAFLDWYAWKQGRKHLEIAIGAARLLQDRLYSDHQDGLACFRYTATESSTVHNANLLGAELLARVASVTGDDDMRTKALRAARFSVAYQNADGAWDYGTHKRQRWVDSFHTGFNLCSLYRIGHYAEVEEFQEPLQMGFNYYCQRFFEDDGAPKYYSERLYPIDIHSAAQSLITLTELGSLGRNSRALSRRVLDWTLSNMWDERGYFYFQKRPWGTVKIPYMRWGQAWMLLALATFERAERA